MGYGSYSTSNRAVRAATMQFATKAPDQIFEQNIARKIHDSMNPSDAKLREACDSKEHPFTVPAQIWLDVTGSMGVIPVQLIRSGLPTMVGTLIENGVKDPAILFGAIGDHLNDRAPLQVGQFESGDAELDMWLTRTWLEGSGGGNGGESYLLAWYFAAKHTRHDAFDLRNTKGFVFTVGDEPCHREVSMSALREIMGSHAVGENTYTAKELLEEVRKKNHVYHIHIDHGSYSLGDTNWKELLGENCVVIRDYTEVPKTISRLILANATTTATPATPATSATPPPPVTPVVDTPGKPKITL